MTAFKSTPSLVRTVRNSGFTSSKSAKPGISPLLTQRTKPPSDRCMLICGGVFTSEKVFTKWLASGETDAACHPGFLLKRWSSWPSSLTR